jgi:cell division protein FtsW (lipid II flippase)
MADGPVTVSAAIFVSLIFLDLFRQEYERVPIYAIFGFFVVLLMSTLCTAHHYFLAWFLLSLPFLILILGLVIRKSRMQEKKMYPMSPLQTMQPKHQPAPA